MRSKKAKNRKHYIETPQYPGGKPAMDKFLQQNLKYPQEALEKKIEGEVKAEYFVDGLGRIVEVNILIGIGHGCDEEVIRLIKSLVFEKAVQRGLKTKTRMTLNVNFKLPVPKKTTLTYNVVPEKKTNAKPSGKTSTYGYKINISREDQ